MESLDGEFARWARDEREADGAPGAPDAGWGDNPGWGGGRYDR
ncbi:hypothetical protein HMPREF1503_1568 [Olsenella uli MSTE5]|nr:hypothetical protein HMPREF1503_1568 [Olsenella uli MSTE5]